MILNGSRYWVLFLLVIMVYGCITGRRTQDPLAGAPEWVRSRPVTNGYYTGIGWAQKTRNVNQFQQAAKQNAMADMASEISVSISMNSVLHAFESNLGFREDFTSTIRASAQADLEGYEIVDTWEDQDNYWVYYRLPVSRYIEIKERKRNDAAKISASHLEDAISNLESGHAGNGLTQLIRSMEAIRNYLDDPVTANVMGREVQIGNEIFNQFSRTISDISINPANPVITVRTGSEIPATVLSFGVIDGNGNPLAGLPLIASFSERPIRNNRARTSATGTAGFSIDAVRSSRNHETFTVRADIETIMTDATSDPVIRRLLGRFDVPSGTVRINIVPPGFTILSSENNLGETMNQEILAESFRKNVAASGYILFQDPEEADYIIRISADTRKLSSSGIYTSAVLEGTISIVTNEGTTIYHRELEGFRGGHFDAARAGEEAFRQAARRIDSSWFREIDEIIRRGSLMR